jgi:hypothetical protein
MLVTSRAVYLPEVKAGSNLCPCRRNRCGCVVAPEMAFGAFTTKYVFPSRGVFARSVGARLRAVFATHFGRGA